MNRIINLKTLTLVALLLPAPSTAQMFNMGAFWKRKMAAAAADVWTSLTAYSASGPVGATYLAGWGGLDGSRVVMAGLKFDDAYTDPPPAARSSIYNPTTRSSADRASDPNPTDELYAGGAYSGGKVFLWGNAADLDATTPVNTEGRIYDVATDSWSSINTSGAPAGRKAFAITATGTQLLIWGGKTHANVGLTTGGRYTVSTNSWQSITTSGAPAASTTAYTDTLWTGTQMIVWRNTYDNSGRYNPATDTWSSIQSTGAAGGIYSSVIWAGTRMVVWGGAEISPSIPRGGRYTPGTDSWQTVTTSGAPTMRLWPVAVWTGSKIIYWGGVNDSNVPQLSGGIYDPATDTWTSMSAVGGPTIDTAIPSTGAANPTRAVWTGSKMVVYGNNAANSAVYDPATDTWEALIAPTTSVTPIARIGPSYVWTGSKLILFGGMNFFGDPMNRVDILDPSTDTWTYGTTASAPSIRTGNTAVWTGTEMIVWGGLDGSTAVNTGGRYNPTTNAWTATNTSGAPTGRTDHIAVWAATSSQMIVWGGTNTGGTPLNDGGRYNTGTNNWSSLATLNAPSARFLPYVVWTGTQMIVWSGQDVNGDLIADGAVYTLSGNSWAALPTLNAPAALLGGTAVWTGSVMIVWGGSNTSAVLSNAGAMYDPGANTWTAMSTLNAPDARSMHSAVWTGSRMIVWGGGGNAMYGGTEPPVNTGKAFNPTTNTWTDITTVGAPMARAYHLGVWTGTKMLIWGGVDLNTFESYLSGGQYEP
ncbi:MAG: hypothetical protein KF799_14165 [Bdellovibrionales bacterium]|nr:hypothetical protein [Bdellovibrionales bacterium]